MTRETNDGLDELITASSSMARAEIPSFAEVTTRAERAATTARPAMGSVKPVDSATSQKQPGVLDKKKS